MIDFIYSRNLAEMLSALFVWMKFAGFNNKIKVAKRIGYGYRDDEPILYSKMTKFKRAIISDAVNYVCRGPFGM